MGRRSVGRLVVALFIGVLVGNMAGEVLKILFQAVGLSQSVVQKVLLDPLVQYEFSPVPLNLIILTLTFGFTLDFSLFSLMGMGVAYYYFKYSY